MNEFKNKDNDICYKFKNLNKNQVISILIIETNY